MRNEAVEILSSEEARQEAERHRQDLADTLDALSERVGGAVEDLERRVTWPMRWAQRRPFASLGLAIAAGFLVGRRLQKPSPPKAHTLARELEGAYLQGRYDEREQRPMREPEYWAGARLTDGVDVGAVLIEAVKPLLTHLIQGIAASRGGDEGHRGA